MSEVISPVALLLVVVLTSGAAFLTSGRPMPPALAVRGVAADRVVRRRPGRVVAGRMRWSRADAVTRCLHVRSIPRRPRT